MTCCNCVAGYPYRTQWVELGDSSNCQGACDSIPGSSVWTFTSTSYDLCESAGAYYCGRSCNSKEGDCRYPEGCFDKKPGTPCTTIDGKRGKCDQYGYKCDCIELDCWDLGGVCDGNDNFPGDGVCPPDQLPSRKYPGPGDCSGFYHPPC